MSTPISKGSSVPLPPEFLARLDAMGLTDQVMAACWDGAAFLPAPKTCAVFGEPALVAEATAALAAMGLSPRLLERADSVDASLLGFDGAAGGVGELLVHAAGLVYAQERSSFHALSTVLGAFDAAADIAPKAVLDLCAAPGGKSLLLARWAARHGAMLVANEPVSGRRKALLHNLHRCGAPLGAAVTGFKPPRVPADWSGAFDVVLVDAPCGGEGLLRKQGSQGLAFWSLDRVAESAARQEVIVDTAVAALAPGGCLVYSTCTFAPEENELQVAAALARHPDLSLAEPPAFDGATAGLGVWEACALPVGQKTRRFLPRSGEAGEGLFLALLRKPGGAQRSRLPAGHALHPHLGAVERSDARAWPKLHRLHPDQMTDRRNGVAPVQRLDGTLAALESWLADPPLAKLKRERAIVWRHLVLLLEIQLKPGRFMRRVHPLVDRFSRAGSR